MAKADEDRKVYVITIRDPDGKTIHEKHIPQEKVDEVCFSVHQKLQFVMKEGAK